MSDPDDNFDEALANDTGFEFADEFNDYVDYLDNRSSEWTEDEQ